MRESESSGASPIFLVGMMGVGKSTIGPSLAERLGCSFLDTDEEVERTEGRSIAAIFATDGEAAFRVLERRAIEAAASLGGVVALGGGAMAQPDAAERLLALGEVVYLKASPSALLERIGDPESRPLLAGLRPLEREARIEALLEERCPDYERAQHEIEASGSVDVVVDRILESLATVIPTAVEGRVE